MNPQNLQTPDFESIKKVSADGAEYWTARDLAPLLGYIKWQNFESLVARAINLIQNAASFGSIQDAHKTIIIGKGGRRNVRDYWLDRDAVHLITELASSYKLTKHYAVRNETVLLALLAKYCLLKGIAFEFQYSVGNAVFDCLIGNFIAIEFDEPHHRNARSYRTDTAKDAIARSHGLQVRRFDLSSDIVDMIVQVEQLLEANISQSVERTLRERASSYTTAGALRK